MPVNMGTSKVIFSQLISLSLAIAALGGVEVLEPKAIAETQPIWCNCPTREVVTSEKTVWCDRWKTLQNATVIFGVALDPPGKAVSTYLTALLDIDGESQALTPVKLGERIALR